MTDPTPYQPVPLDIPAGHSLLDVSPIVDFRALGEAGPSGDQLAAALKTLAAAGISVDGLSDPDNIRATLLPGQVDMPDILATPRILAKLGELAQEMNALAAEPPLRGPGARGHVCYHCNAPATRQWTRRASAQEAEDWHAGREQHIRAHNDGRTEAAYVSDRTDMVTLAVHGCDDHNLAPEPESTDGTEEAEKTAKEVAEQAGAALRVLLHDADCGGHGACGCGDDRDA